MIAKLAAHRRRRWRRAVARHRRVLAAGLVAAAVAAALQARSPAHTPTEPVLVAARDLPAGRTLTAGDLAWRDWLAGTAPDGVQRSVVTGRVLGSAVRSGEPITDARLTGPGLLAGQPAGTRAVTVRLADPSGAAIVRPGNRVEVLAASNDGDALGGVAAESGLRSSGSGVNRSPGPSVGLSPAAGVEVVVESAVVLGAPGMGCPGGTGDPPEAAAASGSLGGLGSGALGSGSLASGALGFGGCPQSAGSQTGVLVLAVDGAGARRLAAAVTRRSLSVAVRS